MLKRINWRMVLNCFLWAVCLSGLVVLMSFIEVKKQEVKVSDVKILIPGANNFLEREEIDAILKQGYGELKGRSLENVNIHAIEQRIKANPYIAFVKVYADMDGVIRIMVKQRQPVLRVINAGDQDFYIDQEGFKMPVSTNFTANVLVATGNITEPFIGKIEKVETKMLLDLYKTALYIKNDTLWDAQIEQIFVDGKSDIELVPRVGIQKIILGNADQLEIKMQNLLIFYKKAMPKVGWDTYKSINVKYINQIVCEKNKPDSATKVMQTIQADSAALNRQLQDSLIKSTIRDEMQAAMEQETAKPPVAKTNAAKPETDKKKNEPAKTPSSSAKNEVKPTSTDKKTPPDKTKKQ